MSDLPPRAVSDLPPRGVSDVPPHTSLSDLPPRAAEYWRRNLRLMASLLAIWFAVSFGAGILFVDALNTVRLFGFPLGFFMAQQGAIYVFVALIFFYAWRINRIERELDVHEQ